MKQTFKKFTFSYFFFTLALGSTLGSINTLSAMDFSQPCKACTSTGIYCTTCKGSNICKKCQGSGTHYAKKINTMVTCKYCNGSKHCTLLHQQCLICKGSGRFHPKQSSIQTHISLNAHLTGQSCSGTEFMGQIPCTRCQTSQLTCAVGHNPFNDHTLPVDVPTIPTPAPAPAPAPAPTPIPMPQLVQNQATTHCTPAPAPTPFQATASTPILRTVAPAKIQYTTSLIPETLQALSKTNKQVAVLEEQAWQLEHAIEQSEDQIHQIYSSDTPTTSTTHQKIKLLTTQIQQYNNQLARIHASLEIPRHNAATLSVILGYTQAIHWKNATQRNTEKDISVEVQRLKENDQHSLTKKVLRLLGHIPLMGGQEEVTLISNDRLTYKVKATCVPAPGIPEQVVLIQLPSLEQTGGTCGYHALYNTIQLSTYCSSLNSSLTADRVALAGLLDSLCAEKAVLETGKMIEKIKNLRVANHKDTEIGMTNEEGVMLSGSLIPKNDFVAVTYAKYFHSASFNFKFKSIYDTQQDGFSRFIIYTLLSGLYPIIKIGITNTARLRSHAIVCKIERLLNGIIGIIIVNSGADRTFVVGQATQHEYVNEVFINDLARNFSMQHGNYLHVFA